MHVSGGGGETTVGMNIIDWGVTDIFITITVKLQYKCNIIKKKIN